MSRRPHLVIRLCVSAWRKGTDTVWKPAASIGANLGVRRIDLGVPSADKGDDMTAADVEDDLVVEGPDGVDAGEIGAPIPDVSQAFDCRRSPCGEGPRDARRCLHGKSVRY